MARVQVLFMCALVLMLLVMPCSAGRLLRGSGGSWSDENFQFEERSAEWSKPGSEKESGDDAVPVSSALYNEWARLTEELVTQDYGPPAANPSVVCCGP